MAAARYQVARVAHVTKIPRARLDALIKRYTTPRSLGLLGEPVVNVVRLDLALWQMQGGHFWQ